MGTSSWDAGTDFLGCVGMGNGSWIGLCDGTGWLAAAGGTELAFVISGIVPVVLAVVAAAAIRPSITRRILAPFAAETRT